MTAPAAPWQLDRLSTTAREAAEFASLGAGISLSHWLTRLIGEASAAEGIAPPSEPPKILELTRELRDRVLSMVSASTPAHAPPSAPPAAASATASEPAPLAPLADLATQPRPPAPAAPLLFRPIPIPTPIPATGPIPPPTSLAAPMTATRPAPVTPPPFAPSMPAAAVAQSIPSSWPAGATMIPVAAIVAANLGTRRGEDVPDALLNDIATRGVRQPMTVRRSAADPERFDLICGHRRLRAAQRNGLAHVPATIIASDDAAAILASLVENLQLGTLSVIDEAQAYLRLLTQCAMDASAVTEATGRDRKHIVQSMRLLGLPPLVRHLIGAGMLSRDHAHLLLDAPHPEALADAILAENLSVEAARQRLAPAGAETKP